MNLEYRPYVCSVCGHKDKIQTNHEGPVLHYCKGCSWKPSFGKGHKIPQLGNHTYRMFTFDSSVNESKGNRPMRLEKIRELKGKLSAEQKQKLLVGLRKMREGMGNIGGETDIANPDNFVAEDEFTANLRPEPKVVAKTFDTNADFDSYVNQRRGIEMTPKERQALAVVAELATAPMAQPQRPQPQRPQPQTPTEPSDDEQVVDDKIRVQRSRTFTDETQGANILSNFLQELGLNEEQPVHGDKFFLRYELTDEFGKNTTTVIKKLKEGNMFCWTAFSKFEDAEEEGKPEGGEDEEK